jgi:hypothetical protein
MKTGALMGDRAYADRDAARQMLAQAGATQDQQRACASCDKPFVPTRITHVACASMIASVAPFGAVASKRSARADRGSSPLRAGQALTGGYSRQLGRASAPMMT